MPHSQIPTSSTKPSASPPAHDSLRVRVHRLVLIGAWALAIILLLRFFEAVRFVALGLLATAALVAALRPLVERVPGPRPIVAVCTGLVCFILFCCLVWLIWWLLSAQIGGQVEGWPELRLRIDQQLSQWSNWLRLDEPMTLEGTVKAIIDFLHGEGGGSVLARSTGALTNASITLAFLVFGTMFLLAEPRGKLLRPFLNMWPPRYRMRLETAISELEPQLRWWVIGTLISMCAVGIISGVGYSLIGLEVALPLALLAAFLELVPTLGPILSWIAALLVAGTQGRDMVIGVTVVYAVVQTLESWIILPLVMRGTVRMPPAVTLFTAVLWGKALGVGGLLLAVPINLLIWSLARTFLLRRANASKPEAAAVQPAVQPPVEALPQQPLPMAQESE